MELANYILIRLAVSSFVLWMLLTASGFVAHAAETVVLPPDGGRSVADDYSAPGTWVPLPLQRPASALGIVPVPATKPGELNPLDVIRSYHRDRQPGDAGARLSLRTSYNEIPTYSSVFLRSDQIGFPIFSNMLNRYVILVGA